MPLFNSYEFPVDPIADLLQGIKNGFDSRLTTREIRQHDAINKFLGSIGNVILSGIALTKLSITGPGAIIFGYFAIEKFTSDVSNFVINFSLLIDAFGEQKISAEELQDIQKGLQNAVSPLSTLAETLEKQIIKDSYSMSAELINAISQLIHDIYKFKTVIVEKNASFKDKLASAKEVYSSLEQFNETAKNEYNQYKSSNEFNDHQFKIPNPNGGSGPGYHPIPDAPL